MKKLIALALWLLSLPLAAQNMNDHNYDVAKNLEVFNAIYKNLDFMYVDTLNATDVVGTASTPCYIASIPTPPTIPKTRLPNIRR